MAKQLSKLKAWGKELWAYKCVIFLVWSMSLLFVTLFFVIMPARNKMYDLQIKGEQLKGRIARVETFKREHEDYEKYLAREKAKLATLRQSLPRKLNTAVKLEEAQHLVMQTNVILRKAQVTEQKATADNAVMSTSIELDVEGDYLPLMSFVKGLENVSLTGVDELHLEMGSNSRILLHGIVKFYALHQYFL